MPNFLCFDLMCAALFAGIFWWNEHHKTSRLESTGRQRYESIERNIELGHIKREAFISFIQKNENPAQKNRKEALIKKAQVMMRLARWIHNICFHPTMDVTTTKNLNVALLGLAFMLIFTAFQTMGNIQTTLLQSAANPDSSGFVPGFHGSGYTSLAIIYAVFATANWVSPPVVAWLGSRLTMVVGALLYAVFIAQFYWPNDILLYGSSALIGLGAAILWTAQGNFLTLNSDSATMTRNSGVFWAMLMSSNLIGNTFVFFQFRGLTDIDEHTRSVVVIVLLVISLAGTAVLFLLRKPSWTLDGPQAPDTPTQAFQKAWRLFLTPQMLLLCVTFFYTGLELTFWSGVYGPSIGFTKAFGLQAKSLVGLHGILIGAGEIVGGLLFGIFGHVVVKRGRDPIIILGFLTHCITFFGIFLNLPNSAPSGNADHASAYIESNAYLAIACSFSLGFGDACYNTQIFSILGSVYSDNSAGAFALFKFVQSTGAALAFFYSYVAPLYYQLLFLVILCVLGTLTFLRVELNTRRAAGSIPVPTVDDNESFQGDIVEQPGNQLVH